LALRHQIDPKRMTALSYGESRPIADNRTAEGRALNRRVEFKVLIR
jgi:outer membrane protein OmpA-like peptidoglycan-associated protein